MRNYISKTLFIGMLCLSTIGIISVAKAEGEYLLGPRDKVRINIVEWRATLDEIHSWNAVNRVYVVAANGAITIPLVGRIRATGLNTSQLSDKISTKLQEKMDLATEPDTTVEVVEYRPFFILGLVDKPGEYAFRPGLTVLQALSISGGIQRSKKINAYSLERERINNEGTIRNLIRVLSMFEIRQLRLQSELDGKDELHIPLDVARDLRRSGFQAFVTRAMVAYKDHSVNRKVKLKGIVEKRKLVAKRITALKEQVKYKNQEIKLILIQRKKIRYLRKRKLVNNKERFRLMQLHTLALGSLSEIKVEQIEAENSYLDLSQKIEQARSELKRNITTELEEIGSKIRQSAEELRTANILKKNILTNDTYISHQNSRDDAEKSTNPIAYKIVRSKNGILSEFDVTGGFHIRPGDVLKINRQTADDNLMSKVQRSATIQ